MSLLEYLYGRYALSIAKSVGSSRSLICRDPVDLQEKNQLLRAVGRCPEIQAKKSTRRIEHLEKYLKLNWEQPTLLIHEPVHAYQDQASSRSSHRSLAQSYDEAKDSGDYDEMADVWGPVLLRGSEEVENPVYNKENYGGRLRVLRCVLGGDLDAGQPVFHDLFTSNRDAFDSVWKLWW